MEKGLKMKIICVENLPSTQIFLCEQIRQNKITQNTAIYALEQSSGIGSRENLWTSFKGNLHLSFCIKEDDLSKDLKLSSASIYFAFLLKECLAKRGSNVWLKWPNDLYIDDLKVGGLMSSKIKNFVIVGVGLNLKKAPNGAGILDIEIDLKELVHDFVKYLDEKIQWKDIFNKYVLEFEKSRKFSVHYKGKKYPLDNVLLYEDGSILLDNVRVYSLR
ncbi:biotin--[acetyl-CoA-carboxylase] ligase [Campylobacter sp. LR196d]|uniref:biotin--[acetyl-CoA-carboxylase] ligase n=1 Tax=Campylobacter sp. LR196d TaxID=2593543 RepID=UPI001238D1E2|nr:biotin--[acetyl-CoA-carboxylase] ligase [Campylobacter sp. LR196d]KAA6228208.1 biotin--[acetyl-CoA-carboxylase] ligase [Campylobacter sp. LR196d]